ncbi:uncharacterized protein A4U43_C03F13350 [Asparagus officinalis]|uniref:Uncharacterized protein n=1 Tax=Asparagus officinalis TaxID=4686 RepID=A0A5P1FBI2_ASPOF|nr:zinc finger CCCH domain-containing protein 25 [Asparagus officinalis]ONK75103.1 uncharacterized protein A4U43_C03F13350 [Asparagus officinalis]
MNPLTLVKRTQKINSTEAALGISEDASWHAKYKDSAYVFVGGIPYDLTEGDLLAVFAQYGEVVDVNLVRDKGTGKSKGFAFLAYEDQRSTVLAVDNLNGAKILGRIVRVDHVTKYKKKEEEEDDEKAQQEREKRGVCRAFQKGECTRGASCKFSHDEQRNANTGWGPQDTDSRWNHDRYDGPPKSHKNLSQNTSDRDSRRTSGSEPNRDRRTRDQEGHRGEEKSETRSDSKPEEYDDRRKRDKHSERYRSGRDRVDDLDRRRDDKRSRHEEGLRDDKRSRHDRPSSPRYHR